MTSWHEKGEKQSRHIFLLLFIREAKYFLFPEKRPSSDFFPLSPGCLWRRPSQDVIILDGGKKKEEEEEDQVRDLSEDSSVWNSL